MYQELTDFLVRWEYGDYQLTLWEGSKDQCIKYRLENSEGVIFENEDIRPSSLYSIDGPDTVFAVLGWLTIQEGSVDPEYFEYYTQKQLDWKDSHGEALSALVWDFKENRALVQETSENGWERLSLALMMDGKLVPLGTLDYSDSK